MKVTVIGAGWAGLACAVRAVEAGHKVTVLELASMPGGRARSDRDAAATDNGQHLLLAAYDRTLALMRTVGVDPEAAMQRLPLALTTPDGRGVAMAAGANRWLGPVKALWQARGLSGADKRSALRTVLDWHRRSFQCAPELTVDELLAPVATPGLRRLLLDPLCAAALNTPPQHACARTWLRVMQDSLFGPPGASDLLVPREPLGALLPEPAWDWLRQQGASVHLRRRVLGIAPHDRRRGAWRLEVANRGGLPDTLAPDVTHPGGHDVPGAQGGTIGTSTWLSCEHLVIATPAAEAARLVTPWAPDWAARAAALHHEPIATAVLAVPARAWPRPILALDHDDSNRPAQFAFHRGRLPDGRDRVALVVSAASGWVEQGQDRLADALLSQCRLAFELPNRAPVDLVDLRVDRRATFRCEPGLRRPPAHLRPGLMAAGDYIDGPYPATLEGAVRSGEAACPALR